MQDAQVDASEQVEVQSLEGRRSVAYQVFLLGVSIYVLAALAAQEFIELESATVDLLRVLDLCACAFFLWDFVLNVRNAPDRWVYLRWGWIDLLSSIPFVDPLRWGRIARMVRLVRALRSLRILSQALFADRTKALGLSVASFALLVWVSASIFVVEFEAALGGQIDSAPEALQWTFAALMGERAVGPLVSPEAQILGSALAKAGVILFSVSAALLVSWLLEPHRERQAAEIREVRAELEAVRRMLVASAEPRDPRP